VVPFAAGGGTDLIARVLTDRLSESLKQRFVVINRPGASTNIGTAAVANAAADGYTLLLTSISFTANPSLYRKLSYSQKDFAPIALIANSPSILVVPAAYPINSVAELVAQLKAHPGELNYASYGAGSGPHLAAGLSAQTGKRQGEAGAIVFGGVRDVGHSRSVDYPIWSTELSAVTGKWRLQTIEINGPIQIGACASSRATSSLRTKPACALCRAIA
jgi:tripartite-type tricarboxylate transporter receptor subunit TctC